MLSLFLKGFIVGFLMLIPGVSGASIAIGLNIYYEILENATKPFKHLKYFIILFLAVTLGIIVSAFTINYLLVKYKIYFSLFSFGIIFALLMFFIKNNVKKLSFLGIIYILMGIDIYFLLNNIPNDIFLNNNLLLGFFLAIALILPGISISHCLLIFGEYDRLILAITTLNISYIIRLVFFLFLGLFILTKLISILYKKREYLMNNIIVGFIIMAFINDFPYQKTLFSYTIFIIGFLVCFQIKNLL